MILGEILQKKTSYLLSDDKKRKVLGLFKDWNVTERDIKNARMRVAYGTSLQSLQDHYIKQTTPQKKIRPIDQDESSSSSGKQKLSTWEAIKRNVYKAANKFYFSFKW